MTRLRLWALLITAFTCLSLVVWPSPVQAQILSHQSIPPHLQPVYDGVNQQMAAKVLEAKTRFQNNELSKHKYLAELKNIKEWRDSTLFKVEYKEHLKGVKVGQSVLRQFDNTKALLKSQLNSGQISQDDYRRKYLKAETNLRAKSRDIHIKYNERMQTLLEKATGVKSSLGSSVYVTENGKIKIDPVSKKPVQNPEARAEVSGGDNDKAGSKKAMEKVKKLINRAGMKVKVDHGTIDIDPLSTTINATSDKTEAKKALKSIAKSKRGVEIKLKKTADVSKRKALNAELKALRTQEVTAKKLLKGSGLKSLDNASLANKEIYNHVRVKEWAQTPENGTGALSRAVVDLVETNDHMNKAAKSLGKSPRKMNSDDVQGIVKAVKKTLGPLSATGQKHASLNDVELGKILQGSQWESNPQEFRKVMSDLKSTKASKDYFHNDKNGLRDLKRIALQIGEQTQTKRLNRVTAEVRVVEARISKSQSYIAKNSAVKSKKINRLTDNVRKINATIRVAKNITRNSMAGAAAHQGVARIPQTNVKGTHPGLRPQLRQIKNIEKLIKPPSRIQHFKAMATKASITAFAGGKRGYDEGQKLKSRFLNSTTGRAATGAMDVYGKIDMARQLYEKTKEGTFASKFKGETGSYEDYKDRAKIISNAIYEVGLEASGVNQLARDRDEYYKQNKKYYEANKVGTTMKGFYALNANLKAGGWFLYNRTPVGIGYNLANGSSAALANYIYDKGDDARRRAAESQYTDNALRRKMATQNLATSAVYRGMFEIMQLQREQDAIANGGYPADSSQARAIAKFLTTTQEPRLLMNRYGDARKLQRMITGEMNELRKAMHARREDGELYDPAYYEGIQNRVKRLNRAMDVTRDMAVSLRVEENSSKVDQKLGNKNTFKLLRSEFKAFGNELNGMQYRLDNTLYDATRQKDREILQQQEHELVVSQTFVDGSVKAIGDFFADIGKIFGGEGRPGAANQSPGLASANNPLASVNQLKDALFDSALDGDSAELDIPTPQEMTENRQNAARVTADKDAEFEKNARKLAATEDRDYKKVVAKIELKGREIERDRRALRQKLEREREARKRREEAKQKEYDGPTMEDMFRELSPEEKAALEEKTRLYREQKWKERAERSKERGITWESHFCSTAVTDEVREAWEKTNRKKCKKINIAKTPANQVRKAAPTPRSAQPAPRRYEDPCGNNLCAELPPELEDLNSNDPCDDPAYRNGRQGLNACTGANELATSTSPQ